MPIRNDRIFQATDAVVDILEKHDVAAISFKLEGEMDFTIQMPLPLLRLLQDRIAAELSA
jgi:hypothetical protein